MVSLACCSLSLPLRYSGCWVFFGDPLGKIDWLHIITWCHGIHVQHRHASQLGLEVFQWLSVLVHRKRLMRSVSYLPPVPATKWWQSTEHFKGPLMNSKHKGLCSNAFLCIYDVKYLSGNRLQISHWWSSGMLWLCLGLYHLRILERGQERSSKRTCQMLLVSKTCIMARETSGDTVYAPLQLMPLIPTLTSHHIAFCQLFI